ncbi:MAG: hypothetical protein CO094_09340 [Anaerolineae bacterium CG_4_9_14_3_um_filter_57_17]|nr:hypothetical protein [bacterium]NCT21180.1 hypothetical protein [bacterium]OIO86826.1 MAG: hypothetical protein AUK01_01705 [Anaerolineae bacterium CG2_30_57_67]PJB65635.1 MAG: hypothetical protein CO094_09340 [Anaerolineae bacterium CG_4_9_14_3_um_filter_57_17]
MKHSPLLLTLLLLLAGCRAAPGFGERFFASGSTLFSDDFSNPQSGWGTLNAEGGVAAYQEGAFRMYVKPANAQIWAHPGLALDDVRVDARLRAAGEPYSNRMGVLCRYVDDTNFYFFIISADGYAAIGKMSAGQAILLTGSEMTRRPEILTGGQVNRLRADCVSDFLILYINDHLALSAQDADFSRGDVGLLAGTFETPGAAVLFDDFIVRKP